jgi:4-amino-4-deoxy-L-arabinose transferase-like glycosyltransferase
MVARKKVLWASFLTLPSAPWYLANSASGPQNGFRYPGWLNQLEFVFYNIEYRTHQDLAYEIAPNNILAQHL